MPRGLPLQFHGGHTGGHLVPTTIKPGRLLVERWPLPVPVGDSLVCVRDSEYACLIEVLAQDLHADRQSVRYAAWDRHTGDAREVGGNRIDVVQVHREGVVRLLADGERHGWCGWT